MLSTYMWKYVDDTTVSETIRKGEQSIAQLAVNQVNEWSKKNLFELNSDKTKELKISFSRSQDSSLPVVIDGVPVSTVTSVNIQLKTNLERSH